MYGMKVLPKLLQKKYREEFGFISGHRQDIRLLPEQLASVEPEPAHPDDGDLERSEVHLRKPDGGSLPRPGERRTGLLVQV